MRSSKNIRFSYLYCDSAKYKLFSRVVFSNPYNIAIEDVKRRIEAKLIDGEYFDPDEWGIPRLRFEDFDEELDHGWCEFDAVEETKEKASRSIHEIIETHLHVDFSKIYLTNDQPVTCPKCGARTHIVTDVPDIPKGVQVEKCLNLSCGFRFAVSDR